MSSQRHTETLAELGKANHGADDEVVEEACKAALHKANHLSDAESKSMFEAMTHFQEGKDLLREYEQAEALRVGATNPHGWNWSKQWGQENCPKYISARRRADHEWRKGNWNGASDILKNYLGVPLALKIYDPPGMQYTPNKYIDGLQHYRDRLNERFKPSKNLRVGLIYLVAVPALIFFGARKTTLEQYERMGVKRPIC